MYCLDCAVSEADSFEMARRYTRAKDFIKSSGRNKLKEKLSSYNFNINRSGCSQIIEQLKHMHQIIEQKLI